MLQSAMGSKALQLRQYHITILLNWQSTVPLLFEPYPTLNFKYFTGSGVLRELSRTSELVPDFTYSATKLLGSVASRSAGQDCKRPRPDFLNFVTVGDFRVLKGNKRNPRTSKCCSSTIVVDLSYLLLH